MPLTNNSKVFARAKNLLPRLRASIVSTFPPSRRRLRWPAFLLVAGRRSRSRLSHSAIVCFIRVCPIQIHISHQYRHPVTDFTGTTGRRTEQLPRMCRERVIRGNSFFLSPLRTVLRSKTVKVAKNIPNISSAVAIQVHDNEIWLVGRYADHDERVIFHVLGR